MRSAFFASRVLVALTAGLLLLPYGIGAVLVLTVLWWIGASR